MIELMAGGALELGTEFVQRPGHGAAGQDFEFGGVKVGIGDMTSTSPSIEAAAASKGFFMVVLLS